MIIYERTVDTKNADKKPELAFAQAAINSDGRITIRNYHSSDNFETITVLSRTETDAIFKLMDELKLKRNLEMPF